MIIIAEMYITLMPVIIAGIFNMLWIKLPYMKILLIPIDNNKLFFDGKRIFGENKTWKGFLGMILLGGVASVLWGRLCSRIVYLNEHNYLYRNIDNTLVYNLCIGFLLGLVYAIFELPNSFLKRRLDIIPGKKGKGLSGILFVFIDQVDSIVGCIMVIGAVYRISISFYVAYVFLGAATHIVINVFLYTFKLRRNMF